MLWKYKKVYQETSDEACDCFRVDITISQIDIDNSDDGIVYSVYLGCEDSEPTEKTNGVAGNFEQCIKADTEMILYILVDGIPTTAIESTAIKSTVCCSAPT